MHGQKGIQCDLNATGVNRRTQCRTNGLEHGSQYTLLQLLGSSGFLQACSLQVLQCCSLSRVSPAHLGVVWLLQTTQRKKHQRLRPLRTCSSLLRPGFLPESELRSSLHVSRRFHVHLGLPDSCSLFLSCFSLHFLCSCLKIKLDQWRRRRYDCQGGVPNHASNT